MPLLLRLSTCCLITAAACGSSNDPADTNTADATPVVPADATAPATRTLTYTFAALPTLGTGYVYEGWLIVSGTPVSAGRFTVNDSAKTTPASFDLKVADADSATAFVLTIEPVTGDAPGASSTHILAGDISSGAATLTTANTKALGTDFSTASGSFVLATPTTGDSTLKNQGIWWLKPPTAPATTPSAGLSLPTLPAGWAYEGWVVDSNGPTSTGRFTNVAASDGDKAGSAKGSTGDGPAFPGQDFITPAKVLNGGSAVAVVSVEPDPDNSPKPFLIKPLKLNPIGIATKPTLQVMTNTAAASLPAGSITITP